MIQVVFDRAAKTAAERKVQHSIANLVKRKLQHELECSCNTSHVVVRIGGRWRAGDFKILDVTSCCLGSLDRANSLLADRAPTGPLGSFTRAALDGAPGAREQVRTLFSLR